MTKYLYSTVGFERVYDLLDSLDRVVTKENAYPPYNLVKTGDHKYLLELAVAGFSRDLLDINLQENKLTISSPGYPQSATEYLHKGIAGRAFERSFTLADTVEVRDVTLMDGILRISLENVIPDSKKPRKLEIRDWTSNVDLLQKPMETPAQIPREESRADNP